MANRTLQTVQQFAAKHPAFPQGGLRWMIFHEKTNGMADAGVILRVGRRVLIDEEAFFAWLDSQNAKKAA